MIGIKPPQDVASGFIPYWSDLKSPQGIIIGFVYQ